jgi:hypothetical protein
MSKRNFIRRKSGLRLKRRLQLLKSKKLTLAKCAFTKCKSPLRHVGLKCSIIALKPLMNLMRLKSVSM